MKILSTGLSELLCELTEAGRHEHRQERGRPANGLLNRHHKGIAQLLLEAVAPETRPPTTKELPIGHRQWFECLLHPISLQLGNR